MVRKRSSRSDVLSKLFPDSEVQGIVRQAFQFMQIAEVQIAWCKQQNPSKSDLVDKAFRWLCPSVLLKGKSSALYSAHVRELIERVTNDEDPIPLTRAEVLALIANQSLIAPLVRQWMALMTTLFSELQLGEVEIVGEPWEGANEELLTELRLKYEHNNPRIWVLHGWT